MEAQSFFKVFINNQWLFFFLFRFFTHFSLRICEFPQKNPKFKFHKFKAGFQIPETEMVLIHFKKTENNQFLYETKASIPTDELIKELVHSNFFSKSFLNLFIIEVNNTRIIIDRLAQFVEDLATYGISLFSSIIPQ